MAGSEKKETGKTLEMRVAELEDKLKGLEVTEEEMRAYNKVASMMATAQPAAAATSPALTPVPDACVIQQCVRPCVISQCTVISQCIRPCVVQACTIRACTIIQPCINECGGGCAPGGGGGFSGGGFGGLGG